jgi:hypothetical protein
MVLEVLFPSIGGAAPSQPIPTVFGTTGNLTNVINHAKIHVDRLNGLGLAGTRKSYVSKGKRVRP